MERLKQVKFFIEANSFEQHTLWRENDELSKDDTYHVKWDSDSMGFALTIGHIKSGKEKLPVVVSFNFAKLNGVMVCFYYATSRGVDYKMVEDYVFGNYPIKYDNGHRRATTDAQNFHHCIHALDELKDNTVKEKTNG